MLPFFCDNLGQLRLNLLALVFVMGQEKASHSVSALFWEIKTEALSFFAHKEVGRLQQNPRAVSRFRVCPHRTAMLQIPQNLKTIANDPMILAVLDIHDKAHAAGIMLLEGIIKCRFQIFLLLVLSHHSFSSFFLVVLSHRFFSVAFHACLPWIF